MKLNFPQILVRVRQHFEYKQRFTVNNKRKKNVYFIIRRNSSKVGLFSYFVTNLGAIAYADRNRYIPVIDMQSLQNTYLYEEQVGKINAWEYYFNQPYGIGLEATHGKKIINSSEEPNYYYPPASAALINNVYGELDYWRAIVKKYIRIKPEISLLIEKEKKYFSKKVLGVSCRGTDYVALKPKGHPIQPELSTVIEKVKEVEDQYDMIYLATEDTKIISKFKEVFGDKVFLYDRKYVSYNYSNHSLITEYQVNRENDKYYQGVEYLVSILLLQECKGLIASITGGVLGLFLLMEKDFDYQYIFDLGYYD